MLTFPTQQILNSSKLTNFQTTISDLMIMAESSLKSSNFVTIESTVGKGEIAHYEQYFLFPQMFSKKLVLQTRKNKPGNEEFLLFP